MLAAGRERLRLPPVWVPLALFLGGTLISIAASGSPAAGLPQVKKIFVFLMLPVVFSAVSETRQARWLVLAWSGAASVGAVIGVAQFLRKIHAAHQAGQTFYDYYVGERITGFTDHWQTFGGEQMIVFLMLAAFLMFSPRARNFTLGAGLAAAALLGGALLLDYTRGIWLGVGVAALYLVWHWKRWLLLAVPVVLVLVLWLNPGSVRRRFESGFEPRKELDSNDFRVVVWRTGWQMIKAHPVLGLGPEIVRRDFDKWVPADIRARFRAGRTFICTTSTSTTRPSAASRRCSRW